ncbi:hypothetical protein JTB14_027576 [Gonioctena quinquepunctata]|nr:hypothetical protein JTB14_027576 [Gonioctena quinquepunctata]
MSHRRPLTENALFELIERGLSNIQDLDSDGDNWEGKYFKDICDVDIEVIDDDLFGPAIVSDTADVSDINVPRTSPASMFSKYFPEDSFDIMAEMTNLFAVRSQTKFIASNGRAENKDRFWKVRILYDGIMTRYLALPSETKLSIDERIVSFKEQIIVK